MKGKERQAKEKRGGWKVAAEGGRCLGSPYARGWYNISFRNTLKFIEA